MDLQRTMENLKKRGFEVSYFETRSDAADYLVGSIKDTTVGIGGSKTVQALDIYDRLCEKNTVLWHWAEGAAPDAALRATNEAKVYLSSANAVAETGEIINIDGRGNRVAATIYNKEKVYIIIGTNKIAENFDAALWRARNVAAPLNAKRFGKTTPCTKLDKCADCMSPERICAALVVLWGPTVGVDSVEVVIINEELGM